MLCPTVQWLDSVSPTLRWVDSICPSVQGLDSVSNDKTVFIKFANGWTEYFLLSNHWTVLCTTVQWLECIFPTVRWFDIACQSKRRRRTCRKMLQNNTHFPNIYLAKTCVFHWTIWVSLSHLFGQFRIWLLSNWICLGQFSENHSNTGLVHPLLPCGSHLYES